MSKLTTADVRYRLVFTDGETLTVQVLVADRAAADAISRKHGYATDSHELRMYAACYAAAARAKDPHAESWPAFAQQTVTVDLIDAAGRPIKSDGSGGWLIDDDGEEIDEDPTRPGL